MTPRLLTAVAFAALASLAVQGAETPGAPSPAASADADWQALAAAKDHKPALSGAMPPQDQIKAIDAYGAAIASAAHAFLSAHPQDPRRFEAMKEILFAPHYFMTDVVADPSAPGGLKILRDEAAVAADDKEDATLKQLLLTDPEVPPSVRQAVEGQALDQELHSLTPASTKDQVVALKTHLDAFLAKYPDSRFGAGLLASFMGDYEQLDAAAADQAWKAYADSPNPAVKSLAAGKLRIVDAKAKPFVLAFTALDGRPVDVSTLRGKVVLIDFWATWCGPCKAEIPNVVATYKKYHDQGFEVVGISLDSAGSRQTLADFVKSHEMAWPQYFDGKGWGNAIAATYSIQAIPAMFLLDKSGKIVSTHARGEELEKAVVKFLAM